jgi:hypothetical protein
LRQPPRAPRGPERHSRRSCNPSFGLSRACCTEGRHRRRTLRPRTGRRRAPGRVHSCHLTRRNHCLLVGQRTHGFDTLDCSVLITQDRGRDILESSNCKQILITSDMTRYVNLSVFFAHVWRSGLTS